MSDNNGEKNNSKVVVITGFGRRASASVARRCAWRVRRGSAVLRPVLLCGRLDLDTLSQRIDRGAVR